MNELGILADTEEYIDACVGVTQWQLRDGRYILEKTTEFKEKFGVYIKMMLTHIHRILMHIALMEHRVLLDVHCT